MDIAGRPNAVKEALVAVLQTSSERDHNTDAGQEAFADLLLPWLDFQYYDEHTVDSFIHGICERRFTAVCFASNSLSNPVIYAAMHEAEAREEIACASQEGMGIVILQQFLPAGKARSCDFLPFSHRLDYRGCGNRKLTALTVVDEKLRNALNGGPALSADASTFGKREPVLWSTVDPLHENAWCRLITLRADEQEHVALMHTRTARSRVLASTLHLDWMADPRLLEYAITLAVRPQGTLFVHPRDAAETRSVGIELLLGRSKARGGHLSHVAIDDPATVRSSEPPFKDFSHLVISEAWGWPDLQGLADEGIRGRLENGGSVTAFGSVASAPGERVLATVSGRPRYLRLADDFAGWVEANIDRFRDAPSTQLRALVVAARAVVKTIHDADEVPRTLTLEELDREFSQYFRERLGDANNVDGHVLPTASFASALQTLKGARAEIEPLLQWIRSGTRFSSFASEQQAQLWLPQLGLTLSQQPSSDLEHIYADLLAHRDAPCDIEVVDRLVAHLKNEEVPLVRRAIIAESLSRSEDQETLAKTASAAAGLQNDLERALTSGHGPLEVVCLLTASFVRIHHAEEFGTGYLSFQPTRAPSVPDLEPALRKAKDEARNQAEKLSETLTEARGFARAVVGIAVVLGLLIVLSLTAVATANVDGGWSTRVAILAAAATATVWMLHYVGRRAADFGCEPRFLNEFRQVRPG